MLLATFRHQPAERLDYDIDYTDWPLPAGDAVASAVLSIDKVGMTILDPLVVADSTALKLWVESGALAGLYKVSITMTTVLGRTKQDEVKFRIKDD